MILQACFYWLHLTWNTDWRFSQLSYSLPHKPWFLMDWSIKGPIFVATKVLGPLSLYTQMGHSSLGKGPVTVINTVLILQVCFLNECIITWNTDWAIPPHCENVLSILLKLPFCLNYRHRHKLNLSCSIDCLYFFCAFYLLKFF